MQTTDPFDTRRLDHTMSTFNRDATCRVTTRTMSLLVDPIHTEAVDRLYAADVARQGFVMNLTRVWAHVPDTLPIVRQLFELLATAADLTELQRGVLVTACASTIGDSYCALAWGGRLAATVGDDVAAAVVGGDDTRLDEADRVLARWGRLVASTPNAITAGDVDELRQLGLTESAIFAATAFVAMRLAFSTVNDALGVHPDSTLARRAPAAVRSAVTFGRSIDPTEPLGDDVGFGR